MFGSEKRLAKRYAWAALETCYKAMEKNPELEGLKLYEQVLSEAFAYDDEQISEIMLGAAESSFDWGDDTDGELRFRDVMHYLLVTEQINVWRRPQLITDITDIVEKTIPANI